MTRLLVFDATNTAYRSKHTHTLSYKGEDVSVLYGVISSILSEIGRHKPDYVVACWDTKTPKFRKELLPEYKVGRHSEESNEDRANFYRQISLLRSWLPNFGILNLALEEHEADDLIYCAVKYLDADEYIVSTTDSDMMQLLQLPGVKCYNPIRNMYITEQDFIDKYGFSPEYYIEYKIAVGDSSDNIKGIQGLGDKYAKNVIARYNTIENAMNHLDDDWSNLKRAHTALSTVDVDYIDKLRKVLSFHENDTVIPYLNDQTNSWIAFDYNTVKKLLISKSFISILNSGRLRSTFGSLKQPVRPVINVDELSIKVPDTSTVQDYMDELFKLIIRWEN